MIRRNDGTVQPSGVEELYKRVEALVNMPSEERRAVWAERRKQMLADNIDAAKFLTWFLERYPETAYQVRTVNAASENDPKKAGDFWDKFK